MFGKEAKDLSVAEQFVLASAVNKPIILLEGSDKLNEVRLDRWRYITEVRARTCAEKLITDEAEQKKVVFELIDLAGGPPDPKVKPKLQEALEQFAPDLAKRAAGQPDHPRQCADAGGALRPARGDEAELRLRLARLRARRDDDVRRGREPGVRREDPTRELARSTRRSGTQHQRRLYARSGEGRRRHQEPERRRGRRQRARARSCATTRPARRRPISARCRARSPTTGFTRPGAKAAHDRLDRQDARRHRHRQRGQATRRQSSISIPKRPARGLETCAKGGRSGTAARPSSRSPARSTTRLSIARRTSARSASPA